MVEYTLSLDSSPQGVILAVEAPGWSSLVRTPWSKQFAEGTQITVTALCYAEVNGVGYDWNRWTDGVRDQERTITLNADTTLTAEYVQHSYYPVRPPTRRSSKFDAKVDYEVYQKRVYALKTIMVEQAKLKYAQQTALEERIGAYLSTQNIPTIMVHHYRNFSQELWALKNKFTGQQLQQEATIAAKKWQNRGLDPDTLEKIAELLNIHITL